MIPSETSGNGPSLGDLKYDAPRPLTEDEHDLLAALVSSSAWPVVCLVFRGVAESWKNQMLTQTDPNMLFKLQGCVLAAQHLHNLPAMMVASRENAKVRKMNKPAKAATPTHPSPEPA